MEIDIYAKWYGQTKQEEEEQEEAALRVDAGRLGYLCEGYHHEPYATRHLVPEAFEQPNGALIPAFKMRERLAEAIRIAEDQERTLFPKKTPEQLEPVVQSYIDFVKLCERMEERFRVAGQNPCVVVISDTARSKLSTNQNHIMETPKTPKVEPVTIDEKLNDIRKRLGRIEMHLIAIRGTRPAKKEQ